MTPHSLECSELLQEYLVSETYAALARHLQSDAQHLLQLLPLTTHPDTRHELHAVSGSRCATLALVTSCTRSVGHGVPPWHLSRDE